PSISETWSRAEPSSVPTTFTVPLTMRTWSSLTGSSKVSFAGSVTDHSDVVGPPVYAPYRGLRDSRYIAPRRLPRHSFRCWPDGPMARWLDRSTARPLDRSDGSGGGGGRYGAAPAE